MKTLTSIAQQFCADRQNGAPNSIDSCLAKVQEMLGVQTGDVAGQYFSGAVEDAFLAAGAAGDLNKVLGMLRSYVRVEQMHLNETFSAVLAS